MGLESELLRKEVTLPIAYKLQEIQTMREQRDNSDEARAVQYILHPWAREHDFFAVYMLNEAGESIGWVVGDYEIVSSRVGAPTETSLERLVAAGIMPICIAGPFSKEEEDSENRSLTLSVARALGIERDPVWLRLIRLFHSAHLYPGPGNWTKTLGLINTISAAYRDDQGEAYRIFESLMDVVRAEIMEEVEANADVQLAVLDRVFTVVHRGSEIKVGIADSDNELIVRAARYRLNLKVVVKKGSSGHATISAVEGIDLSKAVELIRCEEAKLRGKPVPADPARVRSTGSGDVWFYDRKPENGFQALINGGPTSPQTEPTIINANVLVALVLIGLED